MKFVLGLVEKFAPSLFASGSAFLNPWVLLAAVVGAVSLLGSGIYLGDEWATGRQAKAEAKQLAAQNAAIQRAIGRERGINAQLSAQLSAQQAQSDQDRRAFDEELAHAKQHGKTLLSCSAASRAPPARVVCAGECIGLWNDALAAGLPADYDRWRADAAARGADPVGEDDLFRNVRDNSLVANRLRAKLLGWQRKACAEGWATADQCGRLK